MFSLNFYKDRAGEFRWTVTEDESGEIIEQPQGSEVYEKLDEPVIKGLAVGKEYDLIQKWNIRKNQKESSTSKNVQGKKC